MKKFLLIALAALLVLASMVVLADESPKYVMPALYQDGAHYVNAGSEAVEVFRSKDCTVEEWAKFKCDEEDCQANMLVHYTIRPAGAHATVDANGNPVNNEYKGNTIPTCKETATKIYEKCPVCGVEDFEVVEEGEHAWDEGVVLVDPEFVCEKDKVVKYTCTVCGETDEVTYAGTKRAHVLVWAANGSDEMGNIFEAIKTPTCVEGGWFKHFQYCTNPHCDYTTEHELTSQYYEQLDHEAYFKKLLTPAKNETVYAMAKRVATTDAAKWNTVITEQIPNAPEGWVGLYMPAECDYEAEKCTGDGYITLWCPDCDAEVTVVLPKIDHTYVFTAEEKAEPTCLVNGKGLVTCKTCDLKEQVEITAPGAHNDDATGTGNNFKYSQVLDLIDGYKMVTNDINKIFKCYEYTEHAYCAGYTVTLKIGAEEAAEVTITIECDHDEPKLIPGDETLHDPAIGYHVERPATCKDPGYEWDYCDNCGSSFGGEIPKTNNHDWEYKTEDATCEKDGTTVMTCKVCGKVETITHPATGHRFVIVEIKAGDCVKKQNHVWKEVCQHCGLEINHDDSYELFHEIDLTTFDPTDPKNAYKAPTCTEDGSITYECALCHLPVVAEIIPAHGHAWEFEKIAAYRNHPLCDAINNDFDWTDSLAYPAKYSVAGYNADDEFIGWFERFIPATCQEGDTYERKCAICGEEDDKVTSDVVGHTLVKDNGEYVPFVIDTNCLPTCTSTGKAYYNCAVCKKDAVLTLPELEHNFVVEWNKDKRVYEKKCVAIKWADYNWSTYVVENPQNEIILGTVAQEVYNKLFAIDKTYVHGVDCDFCEALETNYTKYTLSYDEKTETVTITPDDKGIVLSKPLVRVTWSYTLSDGTIFSYTRNFKEDATNTFELGGAETPTGAVLDTITVIVVDKAGLTAAEAIQQGYGWEMDIRDAE